MTNLIEPFSLDSFADVFPPFASDTCNHFEFWLVHCIVYGLCDWSEQLFWFWFYDTQLKTALYRFLIPGVNFLSFSLPPDSGERITLVVTSLLTMTVFMLLVAEIMPPVSDVVPIISVYYVTAMFVVKCCQSNVSFVSMINWASTCSSTFHSTYIPNYPLYLNLQIHTYLCTYTLLLD